MLTEITLPFGKDFHRFSCFKNENTIRGRLAKRGIEHVANALIGCISSLVVVVCFCLFFILLD